MALNGGRIVRYLKSIMPATKKKIIVLDDCTELRDVVVREIEEEGHSAFGLLSKAEGYDWIVANKPDLIISDIKSPVMDGMQFLRWLKANPSTSDIPFIFLTAFNDLPTAIEAHRLGVFDYITKPYDLQDLSETINRALSEGASPSPHTPMLDTHEAFRSGMGKFSPWATLRQSMMDTLNRANERTAVLENPITWQMDFLIEAKGALLGGRFFRSLDLNVATSAEVVFFRYTLAEYGLKRGILLNFFDGSERTLQLAALLGVHIVHGEAVDRVLGIGMGSKSKTSIVSATGIDVARLESCDDFICFANRILDEIRSHEGEKLIVKVLDGDAGATEVLVTKWFNGELAFSWSDGKKWAHIPCAITWEVCASLWLKGRTTREEFGLDPAPRECFFALLSSFSSVRCEGDSIVLW